MKITMEQADAAYDVLVREAGADPRSAARFAFTHCVAMDADPCSEYRFRGSLGFGGRLRNNDNRPTPYVDCYPEDLTAVRDAAIERTNLQLAALFSPPAQVERARKLFGAGA